MKGQESGGRKERKEGQKVGAARRIRRNGKKEFRIQKLAEQRSCRKTRLSVVTVQRGRKSPWCDWEAGN